MTGTSPELHWVTLQLSKDTVVQSNSSIKNINEDYMYAEANCKSTIFQIGILEELASGENVVTVQGPYEANGDKDNYVDPGPIGIYHGETDEKLIKKFLGK